MKKKLKANSDGQPECSDPYTDKRRRNDDDYDYTLYDYQDQSNCGRPQADVQVEVLSEEVQSNQSGRLKEAKKIVAGGRGIGGPEHWHWIEEAAAVLDASVACSRPVADSGWVPSRHQVGLSGTSVAPDLYIAVGISGAPQHLAGITGAKTVVAINTEAGAEIFKRADWGVVDDYKQVLRGFTERVAQLRG